MVFSAVLPRVYVVCVVVCNRIYQRLAYRRQLHLGMRSLHSCKINAIWRWLRTSKRGARSTTRDKESLMQCR